MARLKEQYQAETVKALSEQFGYPNVMAVPRLVKISINSGVGRASDEAKMLEEALETVTVIAGQKPVVTKAKMSIANFNLRQGNDVGCRVTLRGPMMYEFYDRLVNVAIPRIRDFTGMRRTSFDGNGNYTMGIDDMTIFPEVNPDKIVFGTGINISIVTTAKTDEEALALMSEMGFPFKRTEGDGANGSAVSEE